MRITGNVEVVSRLLASASQRPKGKSSRSQIAIGQKCGTSGADAEVFLMICNQQNRDGTKYKLKKNVETAFTKFINEGKATVRLQDPSIDICISQADPIQLKSFLSVLRKAANGDKIDRVALSPLVAATTKQVASLKTKLVIKSRGEYPITEGFPSSLQTLQVNGCLLKTVDSRILTLRNLALLDLSDNHLRSLPDAWDSLPNLVDLRLASNQLEDLPKSFCSGNMLKRLASLDLSSNRLRFLRPSFCDLQSLTVLKVDNNRLALLPPGVGKLRSLATLTASNNEIKTLPGSFVRLSLQMLDLSGNSFLDDGPDSVIDRLCVPSLLECSARAIRQKRIPYTAEDVGHLTEYLDAAKMCRCGRFSFTSNVQYLLRLDLRRVAATVTALDAVGRMSAPCEGFLCSVGCFDAYRANPFSSI